jgi:hypothetical protein
MNAVNEEDAVAEDSGHGVSQRSVELSVAFALIALSILLAWDNQKIGAGWGDTGPEAGYFPLRIAAGVGLCAAAIFWSGWQTPSDKIFATWEQLRRVAQLTVPMLIYVGLVPFLGIYVASALLISGFMKFAGKYPLWKSLLLGVLINVLMFYVFELQFSVPLPKGPVEAWLGY